MIEHILLWNYKDDTPKGERWRIEEELRALPGKISAIEGLEVGPVVGGRNQTFTHGFIMRFESMQSLAEYASHPDHVVFAGPFKAACAVQVVADMEVGAEQ